MTPVKGLFDPQRLRTTAYFNTTSQFGISSYFYTIYEKQEHVLYILYLSKWQKQWQTPVFFFSLSHPRTVNLAKGRSCHIGSKGYIIQNGGEQITFIFTLIPAQKPQFIIRFLDEIHWTICIWGKDYSYMKTENILQIILFVTFIQCTIHFIH